MPEITILGEKFEVEFSQNHFVKPNVEKHENKLVVHKGETSGMSHKQILLLWLKKESKNFIQRRAKAFAASYDFKFAKVAIRDQSTRWGSCSSQGNLNFNWRLYLAPIEILDYVIIHELSHTKQMNHSQKFWDIVESILPDYKERRKNLREIEKYLKKVI